MKTRVLWVEDSARLELRNFTGPLYISGEYDLNLAEDATTAVRYLSAKRYDAVILDMRLPPGIDNYWVNVYHQRGEDKAQARLGMELADWLFNGRDDFPSSPPEWIQPHHIAVFTVENDPALRNHLQKLQISIYEHKTAGLPDTILVDLIQRVLAQSANRKGRE